MTRESLNFFPYCFSSVSSLQKFLFCLAVAFWFFPVFFPKQEGSGPSEVPNTKVSHHWLPGTIRQPVHNMYVLAASGTWNMGEGRAILPCWSDSRHYARDRGGLVNGSSYLTPGLPRKMNVLFNMEEQKQKSPTLPFQERRLGHVLVVTPACLCCPYFCHSIWRISPFLPWSTLNCPAHCRDWISLVCGSIWQLEGIGKRYLPFYHLLYGEVHTV